MTLSTLKQNLPVNSVSLADKLRSEIVQGALKSGQRLKLSDLAARYGAGYAPTREALQYLCGEGWVEIDPNRGARVANVSLQRALELFDVRAALEPHIAARFVSACSNNMIAQLEQMQDAFEEAAASGVHARLVTINHDFHDYVSVHAGNEEATRLLRQNSLIMQSLRRLIGHTSKRLTIICDEHRTLLKAFRDRDEKQVVTISKDHLLGAAADFDRRYRIFAEQHGFDPDAE